MYRQPSAVWFAGMFAQFKHCLLRFRRQSQCHAFDYDWIIGGITDSSSLQSRLATVSAGMAAGCRVCVCGCWIELWSFAKKKTAGLLSRRRHVRRPAFASRMRWWGSEQRAWIGKLHRHCYGCIRIHTAFRDCDTQGAVTRTRLENIPHRFILIATFGCWQSHGLAARRR